MSWQPADKADCDSCEGCVGLEIKPRSRDLGGFSVRRILPVAECRAVGPFVFFDEMGPADFAPGTGIDVRPHPHIGLSTITYLFQGEILHRDSLGYVQPIRPGAVNWMTAGRGIVHSERTAPEVRAADATLHGIQAWIALPTDKEEVEPSFQHCSEAELPTIELDGVRLRLLAGRAYGQTAPVAVQSSLFYLDANLDAGARLALPSAYEARAIYPISGEGNLDGRPLAPGVMSVLRPGGAPVLQAESPMRVMLLGGEPFPEERFIWWNFVSSRKDRIERAKADWKEGRFDAVPDDDEFIPLPE
ncbi:pirin family protein [Limibacillus sp. MBR-115]|jgi:redox-sensitive bicupin YhaK (pirin superfamily)|uniref:pirin family protein n=1 Tax=Limibacillus sp. MBR-115 TaxID=3156465 RepID=UPI003396C578